MFGFGLSGDSSISTSSSSYSSSDTLKVLLALAALILLCVSVIFSFVEIQYMLRGQTVAAMKARLTVHESSPRGRLFTAYFVEYSFADPTFNTKRIEREEVSNAFILPGTLLINFVPGKLGLSRLAGTSYWWALVMLGTSVMFVVAMAIWFYIDFVKYQRHRARKRAAGY